MKLKKRLSLQGLSVVLGICLAASCWPPAAAAGTPDVSPDASTAVVTASYTYHGDRLADVADGIISYDDSPKNRWTAYESPSETDWVQFDYGEPRSKNAAGVYLFDDGGGVKAPASLEVQYWDGTAWSTAPNEHKSPQTPAGNELNLITFDAVVASKFRVVFAHAGSKSGATEIVFADSGNEPLPGADTSPLGIVSASYTFRLDQVSSVNDGIVSYNDSPANRWTAYESPNAADWVQTNFGSPVRKDAVGIYLFADGGGIQAPAAYDVQYLNADGEWTSVGDQVRSPAEPTGNALNLVTFAPVVAQKYRVRFTHGAAKTGATEIVYVDSSEQSLPAPPSKGTASASYTNGGDAVDSVNDGIVSFSDFPRNRWTAYGSPNAADWVETAYERPYSKNTVGIFIYDDGGGVKAPSDYDVQYWDGSAWLSVPGQIRTPALPAGNALNLVSFDTVIASRFRVVFTHASDARTGVSEIAYVDSHKEPVPVAPPVVEPEPVIAVTAPALGSSVSGKFKIEFDAPDMRNVWARAWHQPDGTHPDSQGYDAWLANAAPDAQGAGEVEIDADLLPHGPLTIILNAWDSPEGDPNFAKSATSYVQLYNEGGVVWKKGIPAPPPQTAGMKVKFEDDFDGPLSVSKTGAGTRYASLKPDWPHGSEFGEAIFADPADAVNPFAVLGGDYLRIRASRAPEGYADPQGWNRKYIGGLLSSVRLDGTGVSATNGYFEARIQMPAGKGAWPAFWLMSQNSTGADHLPSTAELDIVEAYGHDPAGACQAKHWWSGSPESHQTNCSSDNFAYGDNASTWHTYGAKVTDDEVIYYIDDVEVWRHASFAQANTPLYFMLNLALGGGWPIDLSPYGDQIDMYVDYVRVFEPKEEAPASPSPAPTATPAPTAAPSPPPVPSPAPTPAVAHGVIKLETKPDDGGIIEAAVSQSQLAAAVGSTESGQVVIQAQLAPSAQGIVLRLPAGPLNQAGAASLQSVVLDLGFARISVPNEVWSRATSDVVITLKRAPRASRPEEATDGVRGAVYEIGISADGTAISALSPGKLRISLPYTPGTGEKAALAVAGLVAADGSIHPVANGTYDAAAGVVVFATAHTGTFAVVYRNVAFKDAAHVPWARDSIEALAARGIAQGDGQGGFNPRAGVTRAEFVAMLLRSLELGGVPEAADAMPGARAAAWYDAPLAEAVRLGIVAGRGDGTYGEREPLSRQDMAVLLYRAARLAGGLPASGDSGEGPAPFADRFAIAGYASEAVDALQREGWISGTGGNRFDPAGRVTRAQAAVLLWNFLKSK